MPILTDLLDTLRLRARVFHNAQYCGSWAVDISGAAKASFHFVIEGTCHFRLRGGRGEATTLGTGDLLVLPHDSAHLLGSAECPPEQVNQAESVPHSSSPDPEAVALMCGHFEFDCPGPNPILASLPEVVLLRTACEPHRGLLSPVTSAIIHESKNESEGSRVVVDRLAEVLFVHLLRVHFKESPETRGVFAALCDERLRRALEIIHKKPEEKITVTELARAAGMSRSGFADQFKHVVGQGPMEYATYWRLQCAFRWLAEEGASIEEAAARAGYDSGTSFSRAFKRVFNCTPSSQRRRDAH